MKEGVNNLLTRLRYRILQRLPTAFLRSHCLLPLLQCGLVAVSLDHREANSSVMKFFHEIFDCSGDEVKCGKYLIMIFSCCCFTEFFFLQPSVNIAKQETVRQIFEKIGELLVHNLLHASIFVLRSSMIPDVADVLYDLLQINTQVLL